MDTAYSNAVDAELLAVQRRLADYARRHPKIAARLRHGSDVGSDPHVGRLIQAFAMLAARTRTRVEGSFPELIEPLLEATGHPHLDCVPALTVVELNLDPDQPPDVGGAVFPRDSELQTALVDGRSCRFRTCADVELWPVQLVDTAFVFPPFTSTSRDVARASCAVRLTLETMAGNILLSDTDVDRLRFYIHEDTERALRIYEALLCDVLCVQVVTESGERMILSPDCISSAGFSADERLLDSAGQPDGERLLSELCALPARFMFFEISGLRKVFSSLSESAVELNILLAAPSEHLPTRIATDAIRLNCVPGVNLFLTSTENVEVGGINSDVGLVVDSRSPDSDTIHRIRQVTVRDEEEVVREFPPFHTIGHSTARSADSKYWLRLPDTDNGAVIRFVDLDGRPASMDPGIVETTVLCSNGSIPAQLSTEEEFQQLQPVSPGEVAECRFLTRPTPLRPVVPIDLTLRLVSRSLPHPASELSSGERAECLREMLQLFCRDTDAVFTGMVQAVTDLRIRRVTGIHGRRMVCHGLEVSLTLDDERSIPGGMYLFAEVLRRVFSGYATQNTFVRYRVETTSGRDYGLWPTIEGERFIV